MHLQCTMGKETTNSRLFIRLSPFPPPFPLGPNLKHLTGPSSTLPPPLLCSQRIYTEMLCLIFFFFFFSLSFSSPLPNHLPYDTTTYRIDCGGQTSFKDNFNQTWLSDRFYTGGAQSLVSQPKHFTQQQEQTLRFFPISSGKKNCYLINVTNRGRYYFRTFTVYDNYDGKLHTPSFDVSVQGTVVFPWRSPWPDDVSRDGASSDVFAFVNDGEADVCFYGIATDAPIISSLEIVQIDPLAYDSASIGRNVLLVNYGRLTCGSDSFGYGSSHIDLLGRIWQSDQSFHKNSNKVKVWLTSNEILGTNQRHNYFPTQLYQSAVTGSGVLEYDLVVDAKMDYLLWFHFAEIDSSVTKVGQRVFDVEINQRIVTRIDIFKQVGSFAALSWHYIVKDLNSTVLSVKLVHVVGDPMISGLENYALVPKDLATVPDQVIAMRALKDSLRVPDRMGWNGDPCAPSTWDAWEGVTCHPNKDKTALVVSQIDLGSQGLKGYISEQINLLVNLVSLNLSWNSLESTLPPGLGEKTLTRVDLSNNLLSGSIPDSLASSSLQLVLLNDNKLEGKVPEELYSIGVHGGAIDLSGNKGLCGMPSLPACSLFWGERGLSTGGKVAIGLSCLVIVGIILMTIYMSYFRKRRNDYDFGLPQDIMSTPAKRNRYERQKSLMLLEMDSPSPKGSHTTPNPS